MNDIKNSISGKSEFVKLWINICNDYEAKEKQWIRSLREKGFRAAHPNDGWVDRENNKIHFAYPQFNDGIEVGCKVMLGWHSDVTKNRPVKITGKTERLLQYYYFEDIV